MLRILDITGPDICNGLGVRMTLWVSGCKHHCPQCHNEWTWKYEQGRVFSEEKESILAEIREHLGKPYYKGITFSGGDPLCQEDEALAEILEIMDFVKKEFPEKDIWLYTGFTLEHIKSCNSPLFNKILGYVDVLVDGRFKIDKKDFSLKFRGSSNQVIWEKGENGEFVRSDLND